MAAAGARPRTDHGSGPGQPGGTGPHRSARPEHGVAGGLRRLAPKQRAVLVLRYFEDVPDDEIARLLGCKPATVRSQIVRALSRLRALCPDLNSLDAQEARR